MAEPLNPTVGVLAGECRIEELDDTLELLFGSLGFLYDQGIDVTGDHVYITPQLGWPDPAKLFDEWINTMLVDFHASDGTFTVTEPTRHKNPDTLIFSIRGTYLKLPRTMANRLGVGKHLFKVEGSGLSTEIDWFTFDRHAPPIEEEPGEAKRERPWLY